MNVRGNLPRADVVKKFHSTITMLLVTAVKAIRVGVGVKKEIKNYAFIEFDCMLPVT